MEGKPPQRRCVSCGAPLGRHNTGDTCALCIARRRGVLAGPPPVPAGFWSDEQMIVALETRHMGQVIRAYRTHPYHQRSFSQTAVGVWVGASQSEISRLEKGPPIKDMDRLVHWARVLEIPEPLLWFKLPHDPHRPPPSSDEHEDPPAADAADNAAAFARRIAAGAIHDVTLDQVDAEVTRLSQDFVSVPLSDLHPDIRDLQTTVFALVEASRFPNQLRRLYLAASRACGLQAHAYLDLGNYRAAARQAETAWLCADLAGHPPMLAWLRALQSLIAYWDNRMPAAVSLARNGLTHTSTGSVAVRLSSLEARACAAQGDSNGAFDALRAATTIRRTAAASDDEVGLFHFPEAKQAVYTATALLALDDARHVDRAIEQASRALDLYDTGPTTDRSSGDTLAAHLDIATAHLIRADLDAMQSELTEVLATPPQHRTASIIKRTRRLRRRLQAPDLADAAIARSLAEQIDLFCAQAPSKTGSSLAGENGTQR